MRYLFDQWLGLRKQLSNKHLCIFLDYDGTLTPIAKMPQQAVLSRTMKRVLQQLAQQPQCTLVIVSGRALNNLKKMVGLKNIIYVGNHGLEFGNWQAAVKFTISPRYKAILLQIKKKLQKKLAAIKGVFLESKQFALCLHYRSVNKKEVPVVKAVFNRVVAVYQMRSALQVLTGKKVLEIAPVSLCHKGTAVRLILDLLSCKLKSNKIASLYIGDDVTDENAFNALKNRGITVFVGKPKQTCANYYLNNTQEVKILLKEIQNLEF